MSPADSVDVCVVGAGVVGLAIARECARRGLEVLVLEQDARYGEGISSRNSEVIHAGIYYPTGSLKASLCVRGKQLLYEYCDTNKVGHRKLGKLIVATNESEHAQLENIRARAIANGVEDLRWVGQTELRKLEPALAVTTALQSPSTGIISAAELMTAYVADIEAHGGALAYHAKVLAVDQEATAFSLSCDIDGESYEFSCQRLVNSAGLGAQLLAARIDGMSAERIPALHYCKGNYFMLRGKNPFNQLIYPVPDASGAGLGVHVTIDLGNQVKFGPDVEYCDEENYEISVGRFEASCEAIRRFYPGLKDDALLPGYTGIRPKLHRLNEPVSDFVIQGEQDHGVSGLINLFGIESPGLTSSMAIAETVANQIQP